MINESLGMLSPFLSFAKEFCANRELRPVDGEYYDLPGVIVYHTATRALPEKGRLEVNTITPEAGGDFAWQVEITLNDKAIREFIHVIVRTDGTAEETYGKKVLSISPERQADILTAFQRAVSGG